MTRSKKVRKKGVPAWALEPFKDFIADAERLAQVIDLASRGISVLRGMPRIVEVLTQVEGDDSAQASQNLQNAQKEAELAQGEVQSGFPVLHSWGIVGLWALLEALIRKFICEWLRHERSGWTTEPIQRLKVKIGEYEAVPRNQRHFFVAELLEKELGTGLKCGVTRFEAVLEPFGLSGSTPESLGRTIYELSQVRNLIVHRASRVDRRFIQACPWLDVRADNIFNVSRHLFTKYNRAAMAYCVLLVCRVGDHFGKDMRQTRASTEKEFECFLQTWDTSPVVKKDGETGEIGK